MSTLLEGYIKVMTQEELMIAIIKYGRDSKTFTNWSVGGGFTDTVYIDVKSVEYALWSTTIGAQYLAVVDGNWYAINEGQPVTSIGQPHEDMKVPAIHA